MANNRRTCGPCHVCCVMAEVERGDFYKPVYEICKYLDESLPCEKCTVFGTDKRPESCGTYLCPWLRGFGNEEDRPDKSNVLLSVCEFNGGTWIVVNELEKNAVMTTGKNIILEVAKKIDFPAIISDYGSKPPNDFGDRLGIRKDRESKAKSMMGTHLAQLDENGFYNIYKLLVT